MNDNEFLHAFEQHTLPHFPHHAHIRMAWLYLRANGWDDACSKIRGGLQQMAIAHGVPNKYHETITLFWAYMVKAAMDGSPDISDFMVFTERYPYLLDGKLIGQFYTSKLLQSEAARQKWVDPDVKPLARLSDKTHTN